MALDCGVATYGQRFRAIRLGPGWRVGKPAKVTQEKLAKGHFERPAPISKLEHPESKPPKPVTIREHSELLKCELWELLLGVPTDYDRLRWPDLSDAQLEALLAGLKVMPPEQRAAVLRSCAKVVAALPDPLIQPETRPSRRSTPANEKKAPVVDLKRKRA